jgi:molybdopterin-guanine dinucleotide biosynthesis protein A
MQAAGYVLAGGASRRMGADKALLPFRGATLMEHVARAVREAAGSVTVVGPPSKYGLLGLRVIADRRSGCGPLAGIEAALADSPADWALIAACDLPGATAAFFRELLGARAEGVQAVIPITPDGRWHPLAAAYHRSAAPAVRTALDQGRRKVRDAVESLNIRHFPVGELANANTPDDWAALKD